MTSTGIAGGPALGRAIACAALTALWTGVARPEIPAVGREFRTESYLDDAAEREAVAAQRRVTLALVVGAHLRGDRPGSWSPAGAWRRIGAGRADLAFQVGRAGFGADATFDHESQRDGREFERRAWAGVYVPEARLSATGSVGFGDGGYRGADFALESLVHRWALARETMDLRPRVWAWARVRRLEGSDEPVLTPGLGLSIQHAIVVASQASVALAAESDLSSGERPASLGLFLLGWASNGVPVSGGGSADPFAPPEPGARPASPVTRSFFLTFGYGFPLDARGEARLALHLGIRLLRPLGGV